MTSIRPPWDTSESFTPGDDDSCDGLLENFIQLLFRRKKKHLKEFCDTHSSIFIYVYYVRSKIISMTNLKIHLLLTCKIINHMLKKLKTSLWDFHSDLKFWMNISEQKWHKSLPQPINMTNDFKVDVTEKIVGCESFFEMMNLVNSLNFFALNKEFNFLLPERRTEELSYQSRMLFSSDNLMKETNLNATKDADQSDDISAWQEVSVRTKEHLKKLAEMATIPLKVKEKSIMKFSILPEPPNPKKDVAIVKASDIKKLTSLKKILDPAILSDQSDELPTARIILHEFYPEVKLDSTQKKSSESDEIIFDRMRKSKY